jgi:hypothetical protein
LPQGTEVAAADPLLTEDRLAAFQVSANVRQGRSYHGNIISPHGGGEGDIRDEIVCSGIAADDGGESPGGDLHDTVSDRPNQAGPHGLAVLPSKRILATSAQIDDLSGNHPECATAADTPPATGTDNAHTGPLRTLQQSLPFDNLDAAVETDEVHHSLYQPFCHRIR